MIGNTTSRYSSSYSATGQQPQPEIDPALLRDIERCDSLMGGCCILFCLFPFCFHVLYSNLFFSVSFFFNIFNSILFYSGIVLCCVVFLMIENAIATIAKMEKTIAFDQFSLPQRSVHRRLPWVCVPRPSVL